jgi:predicted Zn finger-like uncharacterized protein
MILTCPECGTSYFVDDSRIPANGRSVKCSSCDARWVAMPEGTSAPAAAKTAPPSPAPADGSLAGGLKAIDSLDIEFAPMTATPRAGKSTGRAKKPGAAAGGKITVWLCAALAVVVVVAAAIVFRGAIVEAFPEARAAYAGVGLPVESHGLVIEDVKTQPTFEGGHPVLAVGGALRNPRKEVATAPSLRVSLLDRSGKAVAVKIIKPLDGSIPAGATRHFAVTIADPPSSVHDLEVTFEAVEKPAEHAVHAPVAAEHAAAPAPADAGTRPAGSPEALPRHD